MPSYCSRRDSPSLLYDHRSFGASDGEPRRQINPWIQARGYRDAISYLAGRDDVHPKGIAIWGDSLSGGVALAVAAVDERVAALVAQVPACGPELPPDDPDGRRFRALADTIARGAVNLSPSEVQGPMPVVFDDQVRRPSALQPLTAYRWFIEYGGRLGTQWVNDVTRAQPRTPEPWQPGLCAAYVTCPTIFLVSPAEEMKNAAPTVARHAFERLRGPKEWVDIEGGHFGLLYYPSDEFDRASSAQARFLAAHLGHLSKSQRPAAATLDGVNRIERVVRHCRTAGRPGRARSSSGWPGHERLEAAAISAWLRGALTRMRLCSQASRPGIGRKSY